MSSAFDFWKMCYDYGAVEEDMLRRAVQLNDLTAEEFKLITSKKY